MNNPIGMLKMLLANKNPKQIIEQAAKNNSNPIMNNLVNMARSGNSKGIEEFARNLFKEQGRDFDKEFNEFINNFK